MATILTLDAVRELGAMALHPGKQLVWERGRIYYPVARTLILRGRDTEEDVPADGWHHLDDCECRLCKSLISR